MLRRVRRRSSTRRRRSGRAASRSSCLLTRVHDLRNGRLVAGQCEEGWGSPDWQAGAVTNPGRVRWIRPAPPWQSVTWLARRSRRWATWRVALQAAGADLPDVVKTTVYIATQRRQDPLAAWEVVSRHFGDHD